MVSIIVAVSYNDVIGKDNAMPWGFIPSDMKWFRNHTINNVVVMGRNTWESMGSKPLPNRLNYVVTSQSTLHNADGVINEDPINNILDLEKQYQDKKVFVIGGSKLYNTVAKAGIVNEFIVTRIKEVYEGDTFFNPNFYLTQFFRSSEAIAVEKENNIPAHDFYIYERMKQWQ